MNILPFRNSEAALAYIEKFFADKKLALNESYYGKVLEVALIDGKNHFFVEIVHSKGIIRKKPVRRIVAAQKHPELNEEVEVGSFVTWGSKTVSGEFPIGYILYVNSLSLDLESGSFCPAQNEEKLTAKKSDQFQTMVQHSTSMVNKEIDDTFDKILSHAKVYNSRDILRFRYIKSDINFTISIFAKKPEIWDLSELEITKEIEGYTVKKVIEIGFKDKDLLQNFKNRINELFLCGLSKHGNEFNKLSFTYQNRVYSLTLNAYDWNMALIGKTFEIDQNYLTVRFNERGFLDASCEVSISLSDKVIYVGPLKQLDGYYSAPVQIS